MSGLQIEQPKKIPTFLSIGVLDKVQEHREKKRVVGSNRAHCPSGTPKLVTSQPVERRMHHIVSLGYAQRNMHVVDSIRRMTVAHKGRYQKRFGKLEQHLSTMCPRYSKKSELHRDRGKTEPTPHWATLSRPQQHPRSLPHCTKQKTSHHTTRDGKTGLMEALPNTLHVQYACRVALVASWILIHNASG